MLLAVLGQASSSNLVFYAVNHCGYMRADWDRVNALNAYEKASTKFPFP